jgi:putative DNA primase/helicase
VTDQNLSVFVPVFRSIEELHDWNAKRQVDFRNGGPNLKDVAVGAAKRLGRSEQEISKLAEGWNIVEIEKSRAKTAAIREAKRKEQEAPSLAPLRRLKETVQEPEPSLHPDLAAIVEAYGKAKIEPKPEPEPDASEEEAEEQRAFADAPDEGVGTFAEDTEDLDGNPPVLRYKAPQENARAFARRRCFQEGFLAVRFWQEKFWRWNGLAYEPMAERTIRDMAWDFLGGASVRVQSGDGFVLSKFDVNPNHVNQLIDALKSGVGIPVDWYPPMWLHSRERASEVIVFRNGVLDIRTRELFSPSPKLWVHGSAEYDWEPSARCPAFDRFLQEIHPDDPEAWQAINEMNGVCMTQDVRFEKGWALIGETRGGKGTLIKLLGALVGSSNLVSVSFSDWIKGKAAQALLGKSMIAFPDVRLPRPTRWHDGGLDQASVELALKITSGDKVSIPQLYAEAWEGILPAKIVLASNKVPNFNDLVLPDRFVKLAHNQSFKDREDITLIDRLKAELPGIAAKAMKAYWAARAKRRVIQPQSGLELKAAIEDEADPFMRFVRETFVIDPKETVRTDLVWMRFENWCHDNGRDDLLRSIQRTNILVRLKEIPGLHNIKKIRPKKIYHYTMLRWR